MLLQDVLKEFLFDIKLKKYSERTILSYKNNNLKLFVYLYNEFTVDKVEDVLYQHVQSYINFLSEQGKKETYINGLIKVFRAFFKYCTQEGYITRNPMDKIKWQKEEIPVITTFNDNEVRCMVNYYNGSRFLDVRNRLIMIILFDSGIRNFELCNIKLEDIKDTYIVIHGKGKKVRHVPITVMINKYMIKYLRVREAYISDKFNYQKEYLLLTQKGKKIDIVTIERVVKECGDSCGVREEVRCSPHTCRHYYAQTQLRNGCDLFTLSRLLGHSNINITKIYLNSIKQEDIIELGIKTSPLSNL